MKSDTLKTFAGLIIIGGIVVATFLYGNSQRQAQLANDQKLKKQQEIKVQGQTAIQPSATVGATAQANSNTAAVKSPASNSIQGSAVQSPTPSPIATNSATLAATTPVTGASGVAAPLPDTGPELAGMLGLGSITAMVIAVRGSRRAILKAARTRR